MQQGRVQLDADWNEQADIERYRRRSADRDLIGHHGGPKGDAPAGFAIRPTEGGGIAVTRGRYYVDGILCENEADLIVPAAGDALAERGLLTFPWPLETGYHFVYLDVWERHVSALEDPNIREVALGGPDTATRTEVAWEIRARRSPGGQPSCSDPIEGEAVQGMMKARYNRSQAHAGPCEITAGEYRRLENQLYRVEVHEEFSGGHLPLIKWSRDNAAFAARCSASSPDGRITLKDAPSRVLDAFRDCRTAGGRWIEITDELRERKGIAGVVARLIGLEGEDLIIDPETIRPPGSDTVIRLESFTNPTVRLWDYVGSLPGGEEWMDLEEGIQVAFRQGALSPGDYWLIPSRTITDAIEWPLDAGDEPAFRPPDGVEHHYCPLAILGVSGGTVGVVKDCRRLFPPATAISAEDVDFSGTACEMEDSTTVQEALDAICRRRDGSCTVVVLPSDLRNCPSRVTGKKSARICLQAAEYSIDDTIVFSGSGHLRLSGCGKGTMIAAPASRPALVFSGWESVVVEDIMVSAGAEGAAGGEQTLNGVLAFDRCGSVTVERVTVRGAAGRRDGIACLGVWNPDPGANARATASVRIRGCDLSPANRQIGILVSNAGRVRIEQNDIAVHGEPRRDPLAAIRVDRGLRKEIVGRLLKGLVVDQPVREAGKYIAIPIGSHTIRLATAPALEKDLQALVRAASAPAFDRPGDAKTFVFSHVDRVLREEDLRRKFPSLAGWLDKAVSAPPSAARGILIAGSSQPDVRILYNTIRGATQGIHLGVSHANAPRNDHDFIDRAIISGNTVEITATPLCPDPAHGIFTGNCRSLIAESNIVRVNNLRQADVVGIKVYGVLGPMIVLRQNHIENANTGILVRAVATTDRGMPQWIAADNLTRGASVPISKPASMRDGSTHA
ncbi:MAG: hypothetical protein KO206_00795 [Methanomicrobiaceae archaeon]|nr:hypothetical protein [Methanomicrobiaceae archaeon]